MSTPPILRYFDYGHLPADQRDTGREFEEMAAWLAENLTPGPEATVALRKLLESRDAAFRAGLGVAQ